MSDKQFLELGKKIIEEGVWVNNERTGTKCLTVIGHTMTYDVGAGEVPLLNTKQSFPVSAVAEIIGYLRKYTNAQQFADIGAKTWFVNANETVAWLNNPNRKGENDMGKVYGAAQCEGELEKVYNNLKQGIDDRGETLSFWNPDKFSEGCLRPCMRFHTFSILGNTLHLTSESRSVDYACGLNFNSIQCYFLLLFMARITGLKPGKVTHHLINVHIYEEHLDNVKLQLSRKVDSSFETRMYLENWVTCLEDVTLSNRHAREYIKVVDYTHQGKLDFKLIS